jgi:hypothetical protein
VPENPFFPQLMPAIDFPGIDAGVVWTDFSPRIGGTYDLKGDGKTVVSTSWATYYGQMAPGDLSSQLAATGAVFVRYPWTDTNGDTFVQPNEVNTSVPFLSKSNAYDPANPTNALAPAVIDPNIKNDRTREFIVGFDRQVGSQMAFGASYIWRKYDQFDWTDRLNWDSTNYRSVSFAPTNCPAGARCETVTYFEPSTQLPSATQYTNQDGRYRDFNGFEVTFAKRMANRWSMNASYAYNDATETFDALALEDPTCVQNICPGTNEYAPESAGSGIGNVFQNSKWLVKLNGRVQLPYDFNLAANMMTRQGFPFPQSILTPNRANGGGQAQVQLDPMGEIRYDNSLTMDLRVDRTFRFGSVSLIPALDLFNLTNSNTVLAQNRNQAAANANVISGIMPPRVARLGITARW